MRDDISKCLRSKEAFVVRVVSLEQGEVCQVLRENDRDLRSLAGAWLKAMALFSDQSRMLNEIVYLLSSSLFISISLQSTKEENHRAFNESSFESVTDVSNNRHGLPGLIPEHEAIAGLTNPGLSGVFKYPVLSLNVHVPSYPIILYNRG